jgi:hypothetical protein
MRGVGVGFFFYLMSVSENCFIDPALVEEYNSVEVDHRLNLREGIGWPSAFSDHFHPDCLVDLKSHSQPEFLQPGMVLLRGDFSMPIILLCQMRVLGFLPIWLQQLVVDCCHSLDREPGTSDFSNTIRLDIVYHCFLIMTRSEVAGFYVPLMTDGQPYRLHMMSVGYHWNVS